MDDFLKERLKENFWKRIY